MNPAPQSRERSAEALVEASPNGHAIRPGDALGWERRARSGAGWRASLVAVGQRARFAILVYLGSRGLLLVLAILESLVRHHSLISEFQNWDGGWYRTLAQDGYQHQALHAQTQNGFFPLYPMLIWLVGRPLHELVLAGMIISGLGGLVAAVLVQRLAEGWWGELAGRRAVALFCLFPGSIVFSMVYAEGIMIPMAAGCILALQRRRWLAAGILAGLATASEPEAAILVVVCAVSAGIELHRRGWKSPSARRSLVAPLLAPLGLIGVIAFMWAWTGTPLAYWIAQHYGWRERFDPLALPHLAIRLVNQISFSHFDRPTINLNWPVGLIGAALLVVLLVLMLRVRRTISIEAWIWTLGISFFAVTSEWVPPNPRLLLTAFPALIVPAYYVRRRAFAWLLAADVALLLGMSWLTYVHVTLRP